MKCGEKLKAEENCARMFNVEIVLDMKKGYRGERKYRKIIRRIVMFAEQKNLAGRDIEGSFTLDIN